MIVRALNKTFPQWDNVTGKTVSKQLLKIISNHIGESKEISRDDLFYNVYGVRMSSVQKGTQFLLMNYLRNAINYLRTRTNCFIISKNYGKSFFVVKTARDAQIYTAYADARIDGYKATKKRAYLAADEKWYLKLSELQ